MRRRGRIAGRSEQPLRRDLGATASQKKQHGRFLYESFDKSITLDKVIRQDDFELIDTLDRARRGTWRKSDWKFLQKCWPSNLTI